MFLSGDDFDCQKLRGMGGKQKDCKASGSRGAVRPVVRNECSLLRCTRHNKPLRIPRHAQSMCAGACHCGIRGVTCGCWKLTTLWAWSDRVAQWRAAVSQRQPSARGRSTRIATLRGSHMGVTATLLIVERKLKNAWGGGRGRGGEGRRGSSRRRT